VYDAPGSNRRSNRLRPNKRTSDLFCNESSRWTLAPSQRQPSFRPGCRVNRTVQYAHSIVVCNAGLVASGMNRAAEFNAMMFGRLVFTSGAIKRVNQLELDTMPGRSL
jgi:hypothetical protein